MNHYKNINFSKYTSIKIGGIFDVLTINEIGEFDDFVILGKGNNLLISPNTKEKFAILGENFDYIKQENNKLFVGAATSSSKLLRYCKKNNIANFEFLAKIPGSIGGLAKMNAGLKDWEIFNQISQVKTKNGYINKEEIDFSYRHTNIQDIIYEVVFDLDFGFSAKNLELFAKMRENQPKLPSAGSCFKNPPNNFAGKLIEQVGLKGYKKGNMSFSSLHANFLVNEGSGTFEDAIFLINLAKEKVLKSFDIELESEISVYL